jgi:hypothetical protein
MRAGGAGRFLTTEMIDGEHHWVPPTKTVLLALDPMGEALRKPYLPQAGASVLSQRKDEEPPWVRVRWQKRATLAMIASAVFVQMNGFGSLLFCSMKAWIASSSSAVLR